MSSKSANVNLKLHHAKLHFGLLQKEFRDYYALEPAVIVPHPDSEPANPSVMLKTVIPMPQRIPLIAGDCLQNVRSCLDYLVCEMVAKAGKSPRQQSFPVCTTPDGWTNAKKDRLRGVPDNARRLIECLQPYRRGADFVSHPIYVLDELTNVNKHRHLLIAVLGGADMTKFVPVGNDLFYGAALLEEDGEIPAYPVDGELYPQANVASFIAFNERPAKGMDVGQVIGNLINWIDGFALPLFDSFL